MANGRTQVFSQRSAKTKSISNARVRLELVRERIKSWYQLSDDCINCQKHPLRCALYKRFSKAFPKIQTKHLWYAHFKCSFKPSPPTWLKKDSMTAFGRFFGKTVNNYSEIIPITQMKLLYNLMAILVVLLNLDSNFMTN